MVKFFYTLAFFILTTVHAQINYVTTIHPFKEILNSVVKERATIYSILPPGASPHTYELRPSDIQNVKQAQALFWGADNLDKWVLALGNPTPIELFKLLPHYNRLQIKSFRGNGESKITGTDPHFWTDPLAVASILPALKDTLCSIDPEGESIYKKNTEQYTAHLDSLYHQINSNVEGIKNRNVILSHPFFRYYLMRFHINLVGIIETIPGKEPTPKELQEIINRAKKQNVKAMLTHSQLSDRAAQLVSEATGIKVYKLDPIGGSTGKITYDEILLSNTRILIEALK
jgi:zinc transport system substrate-binding protein